MFAQAALFAVAAALVAANPQPQQPQQPQQDAKAEVGRPHNHHHHHDTSSSSSGCKPHTEYVYVHKKPCHRRRYFCPPQDCSVCPKEFGEFFVLNEQVPFYSADCACRAKGGRLAHVSSANFNNAVSAVFECVGPNKYAWVESWNGDNYNNNCLGLYTGSQPGGGSIAVPLSCESKVQPVCQKVHQECHNQECWEYVYEWESSSETDCDSCHPRDRECHRYCQRTCSSDSSSSSSSSHEHCHKPHNKAADKLIKQRI